MLERRPWNRASGPTSLAENIDGTPEDDDLNFTMLGVALLERCGTDFDALDVAKLWLDFLPPGRIFTAERVAMRNLLLGLLPPETAAYRNPFREWIGARLRVDVYGWAAARRPGARGADGVGGRAPEPHRERRLRGDVDGGGARGLADRVVVGGRGGRRACRSSRATAAWPRRCSTRASWRGSSSGRRSSTSCAARYGDLHWVHAINNTALVAAALYAFDGDFTGAIGAVVQGGWDTDTNGAAVGSVLGAIVGPGGIDERWTAPLQQPDRELAARASTRARSTGSRGGRSPSRRPPSRV